MLRYQKIYLKKKRNYLKNYQSLGKIKEGIGKDYGVQF
jgi:hypothetical protein